VLMQAFVPALWQQQCPTTSLRKAYSGSGFLPDLCEIVMISKNERPY
jgi:hypothetical protein